jgi:hypothetical protein
VYDVSTLDSIESNLLFSLYAFQLEEAPKDYKELAKDVVEACGDLVLVLRLIGLTPKGLREPKRPFLILGRLP